MPFHNIQLRARELIATVPGASYLRDGTASFLSTLQAIFHDLQLRARELLSGTKRQLGQSRAQNHSKNEQHGQRGRKQLHPAVAGEGK